MNARNRHSSERSCAAALPDTTAPAASSVAAAVMTNGFILHLFCMGECSLFCLPNHHLTMKLQSFSFCHRVFRCARLKGLHPPMTRCLDRFSARPSDISFLR